MRRKTNKSSKSNNKDFSAKRKGREQSEECTSESKGRKSLDSTGRDNDPNWYIHDKTLAEQVCHLSFNSFLGEGTVIGTTYTPPSIVRFAINPSPFNSYDIQDPNNYMQIKRSGLNLAITKLYTLLASYSGRAANYAPQDVGVIILAMGEIVSCVEDLRRCVGVSYTFSERNRALPKLLTHALGYDYDDFIKNRAIYIDRLNALITRFNALPILANIPYIIKCRDMYQKVYTDSMSPEATVLVPVPHTTWELDETSYSGGTILVTKQWTPYASYNTFKDHLDVLEGMVEALFGSTTLNTIYADMMNLASKIKVDMFKLDYVTEDYIVIPEYNENFLMQIHNADIIGAPSGSTLGTLYGTMQMTPANDVYPDPSANGLIYNPVWNYGIVSPNTNHYMSLVDLPSADPSVENVIESTRFKAISTACYTVGSDYLTSFAVLPDHYIVDMRTWTIGDTAANDRSTSTNWWSQTGITNEYIFLSAMTQIDWAPIQYYQDYNGGNTVALLHGDLNFYTQINPTMLMSMNRIIAQDLFDFQI